jgi:hypothetical protein
MADFGGEMRMTVAGQQIVMRGTFNLDPVNTTTKVITNLNNSISRQFTPDAFGADLKELEDTPGIDWQGLLRGAPASIVIVEEQTAVTHMFTNAVFEGQPSIDRETGSVTGLKIRAPSYIKKVF